jgi:hypothetical protein
VDSILSALRILSIELYRRRWIFWGHANFEKHPPVVPR